MTVRFPEDTVDGFPTPPRTVTDADGREIRLCEVTYDDSDALTAMYLDFDPEDRAQGIPPGDEDSIREWLEVVMTGEALNTVAYHDESPVGHVMLVPDGDGSYELAIFVLQAYQGAGIGTALVRTALGLGQREGIQRIWLTVERWNRPAIGLYEKIGFERTGDDSFELEMSLRLEPVE
ncbi:Acetyltransferase (GNAT) family protein [Halovenus aranensis]|uniref:Acetyltransferase (GNAT) family protein n=1 Tax=Halovenus aranensis TaxID=890420 RepID=A0A1G8RQN3_9EURY|nr:GNAT family N-acetyltransferase [Halovenus aranensis]SDJ18680.1 Acetyltransferase (GNAT) family protein [Halovenus aranensis]